jgi:hypothetical protein
MTLGSPDPTPPGAGCSASSCRSSASTKRPAPALTWTEVWSGRSDFRPQSHRANPGRCSSERPPKKGDLVIMPVIKIIRSSQKLPHGVDQGNGARVVKAIGDVHPIWEEVDHPASATRASGTHGLRSSTGRSVSRAIDSPHFAARYPLSVIQRLGRQGLDIANPYPHCQLTICRSHS